jgi:predicted amidophosphoribosyltransferase
MDWHDSDDGQEPEAAEPELNDKGTQTELPNQPLVCGYCGRNLHLFEELTTVSCKDRFCKNCFELLKSIPGRHPRCPLCLETVQEWFGSKSQL